MLTSSTTYTYTYASMRNNTRHIHGTWTYTGTYTRCVWRAYTYIAIDDTYNALRICSSLGRVLLQPPHRCALSPLPRFNPKGLPYFPTGYSEREAEGWWKGTVGGRGNERQAKGWWRVWVEVAERSRVSSLGLGDRGRGKTAASWRVRSRNIGWLVCAGTSLTDLLISPSDSSSVASPPPSSPTTLLSSYSLRISLLL